MVRWALGVEYCGLGYVGWQSQKQGLTIQDTLESALAHIAGQPVQTICAGRTDAGVHAQSQVVHFDIDVERPDTAWTRGVNSHLPAAIRVIWAKQVSTDFHARYSAERRMYRYILSNEAIRPGLMSGRVGWYHPPLDEHRMQQAASKLLGTHDFSVFRAAACQAKSPIKTIESVSVERRGQYFIFDILANAFLHHMIRNMMGCLVWIGRGSHDEHWLLKIIEHKDRALAAPTFMPDGLYFRGVRYPPCFDIPSIAPEMSELLWV